MGFNTGVLILNDAVDQIRRHPAEFVEGLSCAMAEFHGDPVNVGVGCDANAAAVFHAAHADVTGVYAIGGNHTSRLLLEHNGGRHHADKERYELLREMASGHGLRLLQHLAQEYGYRLVQE